MRAVSEKDRPLLPGVGLARLLLHYCDAIQWTPVSLWLIFMALSSPLPNKQRARGRMEGCRCRSRSTRSRPRPSTSPSSLPYYLNARLAHGVALALLLLLLLLAANNTAHAFHHAPLLLQSTPRQATHLRAAGTGATTYAAVVRERLLDAEREGTLVVSTARFPLIGMPSWSPPLHVGMVLSVEEKGKKKGGGKKRGGGNRDGTHALGSLSIDTGIIASVSHHQ